MQHAVFACGEIALWFDFNPALHDQALFAIDGKQHFALGLARGHEVGHFEQAQRAGLEVAQQTALVWAPQQALFHGGAGFGLAIALELYVVRYALAIEIVQPCRAQRALEAGAGNKGLLQRAGVHVAFNL